MIQPAMSGALSHPYATPVDHEAVAITPAVAELVRAQVQALALSSESFGSLTAEQRQEIVGNMEKICAYMAALIQEDFRVAEQLGLKPMLRERVTFTPSPSTSPSTGQPPLVAQAQAFGQKPPPPAPDEFAPRATGLVAQFTGETIRAIAFPSFVADLIRGTFQAIVNASIQQMEAYANLLSNVAKTVDQFMADNITDNAGRDYLVARYPSHFSLDTSSGSPRLRAKQTDVPKPNFQQDLELGEDVDISDESAEETLMPAARRQLARQRQSLLSTMVMMGINRIVVTSGQIRAEMGFHIVARDTGKVETATKFDEENRVSTGFGGGLVGLLGGASGSFENTMVYVSTTKKDSSDDLKINADLTGAVDLKFKSDYLPLERFANPQLISVIQGNTYNPPANQPTGSKTAQDAAPAGAPAH